MYATFKEIRLIIIKTNFVILQIKHEQIISKTELKAF